MEKLSASSYSVRLKGISLDANMFSGFVALWIDGSGYGDQSRPRECQFSSNWNVYRVEGSDLVLVGNLTEFQDYEGTTFSGSVDGSDIKMSGSVSSVFTRIWKKGN